MSYTLKAYLNASGKLASYTLIHDIKRALMDSKAQAGLVSVLSTQATTAVALLENDEGIRKEWMGFAAQTFAGASDKMVARRSGSGPDKFHLMAALTGLSVTLPFAQGRLLIHAQHEVFALDFDPKPGRREFVITVLPSGGAQPAGGQPAPR